MTREQLLAQQFALMDIKHELAKSHKPFIPFRRRLNPVMEHLVAMQISKQERISCCVSQFSKKVDNE